MDELIKEDQDELEWDDYICFVPGCGEVSEYEGWVHTYRRDGTLSPLNRLAHLCHDHAPLFIGWKG